MEGSEAVFVERGLVDVKGATEPLRMYFVDKRIDGEDGTPEDIQLTQV